ncbi:hypothetical protein ElyMa_000667600 [Elysia marginata]|uniref:Apple domain-containing protein n=1 Tax=Elysia marginata TaxID=1093978 RepID=A0AAV4GG60_9GAST|nr:hypothetical protein ElyMa_000667600 [Elysia marginata]
MCYHFLGYHAVFFCLIALARCSTSVTLPGASSEDCARLCVKEKEIDCRYYKFKKSESKCVLAPSLDPNVSGLVKIEKPEPALKVQPASSWLAHMHARIAVLEKKTIGIKRLHQKILKLKTEVMGLKNSRALTHNLLMTSKEQEDQIVQALNEKAGVLNAESKRVEDDIMTVGDLEKTLGDEVDSYKKQQVKNQQNMTTLLQMTKEDGAKLQEMAQAIDTLSTEVQAVQLAIKQLEDKFTNLRSDVLEKVYNFDSVGSNMPIGGFKIIFNSSNCVA